MNISKEHFIHTQKLTFIISLKKHKTKEKKRKKEKNIKHKTLIYFPKTLMKCTNDEIMVDPKHDGGSHKSCEC